MTPATPTPLELSRRSRLPYHELRRLISTVTVETIQPGLPLAPEVAARTAPLIRRRQAGTPLQYLEGCVEFGPVRVAVDRRALIPRPETEQLWELAIELMQGVAPRVVVEIGTGTGALALALARSFPDAVVVATDICPHALELARHNVKASRWAESRIQLLEGDLFGALPSSLRGRVDLLVSNPPYVSSGEWSQLPQDVQAEPYHALVAGPRGTEILESLAAGARDWMECSGLLLFEIGETQTQSVLSALRSGGVEARVRRDLAGRPRFAWGRPATR